MILFALLALTMWALIMWALVWLARRVRRTGKGANVMGPIDEIYNPSAHRWRPEIEIHEQRMAPQAGASGPGSQPQPGQHP